MIHPDTEVRFVNERIGLGVFSTKPIAKGTIAWTIDPLDRRIGPAELAGFDPVYRELIERYSHRDRFGRHILCWDHARFVNHDGNSNCLMTAYEFEIVTRDIAPGEELTDDYGCLNVSVSFRVDAGGSGRSVVRPDDLLHWHGLWDARLRDAFARFGEVDQPLERFLSSDVREHARAVARGEIEMESVRTCYFDQSAAAGRSSQ